MPSLILGLLGAGLAALAIWFRTGTTRAARWWECTDAGQLRHFGSTWAMEHLALVAVPYLAQLFLLLAVATLPVFHPAVALMLLLVEIVVGGIMGGLLRYRYILPLWMYPAWLRPVREREQAELRRLRAQ